MTTAHGCFKEAAPQHAAVGERQVWAACYPPDGRDGEGRWTTQAIRPRANSLVQVGGLSALVPRLGDHASARGASGPSLVTRWHKAIISSHRNSYCRWQ